MLLHWCGSQATAAYSMIGHTSVRQAEVFIGAEHLLRFCLKKLNVCEAFVRIFDMWLV